MACRLRSWFLLALFQDLWRVPGGPNVRGPVLCFDRYGYDALVRNARIDVVAVVAIVAVAPGDPEVIAMSRDFVFFSATKQPGNEGYHDGVRFHAVQGIAVSPALLEHFCIELTDVSGHRLPTPMREQSHATLMASLELNRD